MIGTGRRAVRGIGNALLWVLATAGAVSVVVWALTAFGLIKPLIVVSGSMEPAIMTGDLLIDTANAPADLTAGEVASIRSTVTGKTVTHRVIEVHQAETNRWEVTMKGDGNDVPDSEPYVVTDEVWQPALRLPGLGTALTVVTRPTVAVPLGIALAALLALSLQGPERANPRDEEAEPADPVGRATGPDDAG